MTFRRSSAAAQEETKILGFLESKRAGMRMKLREKQMEMSKGRNVKGGGGVWVAMPTGQAEK